MAAPVAKVESTIKKADSEWQKWWDSSKWADNEFVVPHFHALTSQPDNLLRGGFSSNYRLRFKPKTGKAGIDKYEAGLNYSPDGTPSVGLDFVGRKSNSVFGAGVNVENPATETSRQPTFHAAGSAPLTLGAKNKPLIKNPVHLRASLLNFPFEPARFSSTTGTGQRPKQFTVAADFDFDFLKHSIGVKRNYSQSARDLGHEWSLINGFVAGVRKGSLAGLAAGAQVESSLKANELRDYSLAVHFARRDWFASTLATENRLKALTLSERMNLGRGVAIGVSATAPTSALTTLQRWSFGTEYKVPTATSSSVVKAKYESAGYGDGSCGRQVEGNAAAAVSAPRLSFALQNRDVKGATLGASVSLPLLKSSSSSAGFGDAFSSARVGLSAAFGDDHSSDDLDASGGAGSAFCGPLKAAGAGACCHCPA